MKIRQDFVTNSSSSSYIVAYEIDDCEEFRKLLKEQLGSVGLKLADRYFKKGKDLYKYSDGTTEIHSYLENEQDFDENKSYFKAEYYIESNNVEDQNGSDAFLADFLPECAYVKMIYNGEED